MTFKIYFENNSTPLDLSSYVTGDATIQVRNDYAFAEGNLTLIVDALVSNNLNQNIPPYTICELNDRKFVCTSVCREYMTQNGGTTKTYFHEVKLLDIMALLETFVLGVKTLSNYNDSGSLEIVKTLLEDKYEGYIYSIANNLLVTLSDASHDYTFKAGTTMYDVLVEMGKKNNLKFYIANFNYQLNNWVIYLNAVSASTYTFHQFENLGTPLSVSTEQNVENYCMYLETLQSNVVDRNNLTRFNDMSCRSSDYAMNADNAEILFPTNVESVDTFIVNGTFQYHVSLMFPDIIDSDWIMANGGYITSSGYEVHMTYQQMIDTNTSYGGHDNIFQWLYEQNQTLFDNIGLLSMYFYLYYYNNTGFACDTKDVATNVYTASYADYTPYLLEETEWNTKTAEDKPKYAVYKSGTNKIYNLNSSYQTDLIHSILGLSTGNFLQENKVYENVEYDGSNYIEVWLTATNTDPTTHTYTLKVYPLIDNMMLINTKDNAPFNETVWKPFTRTYENSGNPVDFNALIDDFEKQNNVLGTSEISVETIATSIQSTAMYYFAKNLNYWYVNSLIYTIKPNVMTLMINGSAEKQKIADVIGVDYQYNPTKLATENIVTRGLYFESGYWNYINYSYTNGWDIYMLIEFSYDSGMSSQQRMVRCVITKDNNDNYYVFAPMLDNYSCGKRSINASGSNYMMVDVPYTDYSYRVYKINFLTLVAMRSSLPTSLSHQMPNITTNDLANEIGAESSSTYAYASISEAANKTIYKDERETLTFTIKVSQ